MIQTHLVETWPTPGQSSGPTNKVPQFDLNAIAWLLMGDMRSLLQHDADDVQTAQWLTATLAELIPKLRRIRANRFESGGLSDLLHAGAVETAVVDERLRDFRFLLDTLDELQIRLEWNLPVTELVPFADLRLARWMSDIGANSHSSPIESAT